MKCWFRRVRDEFKIKGRFSNEKYIIREYID